MLYFRYLKHYPKSLSPESDAPSSMVYSDHMIVLWPQFTKASSMPIDCEVCILKWWWSDPWEAWPTPFGLQGRFTVKLVTRKASYLHGPFWSNSKHFGKRKPLTCDFIEQPPLFNIHSHSGWCSCKHSVKTSIGSQHRVSCPPDFLNLTGEISVPWYLKLLTFSVFSNSYIFSFQISLIGGIF